MFCGKCGASNTPGTRFCGQCGHPLPDVAGQAAPSPGVVGNQIPSMAGTPMIAQSVASGAGQVARSAVNAKILGVVITAAIVTAGIILYNMFFVQKPMDVIEKFVQSINEKDINTAVTCFNPAYEKTYNATSNLLSGFIGFNLTDLADLCPGIVEFAHASGDATDLQMEVGEVLSQQTSGSDEIIRVNIKVTETDSNGNQTTNDVPTTFTMHKYNQGWRISNME